MPAIRGHLTVPLDTFGGLRLDQDPLELGFAGALDLMDVQPHDGGLLARPGFQRWSAATTDLGSAITWMWSDGASDVVVAYGAGFSSEVSVFDREAGPLIAHQTTSASVTGAVQYSGPTQAIYVGNSLAVFNVVTGAALTIPFAGATLLDKTPWDNRLMSIGAAGGNRIYFSDPDDVATFDADNFVEPAPNVGGQQYTASCRWREMVFVFRQSAFFVFTNTSTDSVGGPIFDYRVVDYGVGAAGLHGACAAPEGVYFLSATGLYLTRGGAPELVSDQIPQLFADDAAVPEFTAFGGTGERINVGQPMSMVWRQTQLYIVLGSTDDPLRLMLVFDTVKKTWAIWSVGGVAVAAADPIGEAVLAGAGVGFVNAGLWVAGPTIHGVTDDNSVWRMIPDGNSFARGQDYHVAHAAIENFSSYYRTGYNDFNAPGEKTLRRMLLDGTGTFSRSLYDEKNGSLAFASQSVALGATRSEGWLRTGAKARSFSMRLDMTGNFSLNRIDNHVQRLRQPMIDSRV